MGAPCVTDLSFPGVRRRNSRFPSATETGRAMRVLTPARTPIFTPHHRPSAVWKYHEKMAARSPVQVTSMAIQSVGASGTPARAPSFMGATSRPSPFGNV